MRTGCIQKQKPDTLHTYSHVHVFIQIGKVFNFARAGRGSEDGSSISMTFAILFSSALVFELEDHDSHLLLLSFIQSNSRWSTLSLMPGRQVTANLGYSLLLFSFRFALPLPF